MVADGLVLADCPPQRSRCLDAWIERPQPWKEQDGTARGGRPFARLLEERRGSRCGEWGLVSFRVCDVQEEVVADSRIFVSAATTKHDTDLGAVLMNRCDKAWRSAVMKGWE